MSPRSSLTLLIALAMSGCAATETPPPASTDLLAAIPRVQNSTRSPCWQQQQIAAQNTALDQALGKTKDVYKAPCDVDPKQQPAAGKAKTS